MSEETIILLTIGVFGVVTCAILIASILGMYRTFEKAGEPGIAVIVPFWNLIVLCRIAGAPTWWALLFLIPLLNIVFAFFLMTGVARNFHKSSAFAIGLVFLPFVFYCILGYGSAKYRTDDKIYMDPSSSFI